MFVDGRNEYSKCWRWWLIGKKTSFPFHDGVIAVMRITA